MTKKMGFIHTVLIAMLMSSLAWYALNLCLSQMCEPGEISEIERNQDGLAERKKN